MGHQPTRRPVVSRAAIELDGHRVELTNLDRVVFPDDGITKGDVVDHYQRVAALMLPHVGDRPLVLERFPRGVAADGFYQKNTPAHVPGWIDRVEMRTEDGGNTVYSVTDSAAGLVYLANQGTITFHTLLSPAIAPDRPTEVVFDLDPADDDLDPVRKAARELRSILDELELEPRVKSSGSKGLHVVVDVIDDDATFRSTRAFAVRVAELIAPRGPFTLEHRIANRGGRLYLDVLRNGPASHAVAPYSLRPLPGAPVAVPLDWDEALAASFHPRRLTITNLARRIAQRACPWSDPPHPRRSIKTALAEVERRAS